MLYQKLLRPILFRLPPELVHEFTLKAISVALRSHFAKSAVRERLAREPFGKLNRFGLEFSNPVGLAAGFDKNGSAVSALASLGFGFIEVGTVTSIPQSGNPKPRLFRLPQDRALINRAGFNNRGAAAVAATLAKRRSDCVLGISIGKSRTANVEDAIADYLATFEDVYRVADYVAVNVSSPNTPGVQELQHGYRLRELLEALQRKNAELAAFHSSNEPLPLLLKISPDLKRVEIEAIVEICLGTKMAGVIATNTSTERDGLSTPSKTLESIGRGGLSGAPLRNRSNEVIADLYRFSRGGLTIVGVGGIFTALDAWNKICAGASLIQIYTGFVYEGYTVVRDINDGLAEILANEGFSSLDEAVGCRVRELAVV